ncbi:acetyltransferase [Vagococcus sp. CY52-2]|uniref:acetyltransferase n=1 Tax=Vagococcus sp. CY52-2 TaxID=2925838 RepID=UPI001F5966BE|nr:acetyltransferase [Vagococcus sp. CY52-2]UNM89966.1 acetyltransferase [Vagococcus sp. CY52-2]
MEELIIIGSGGHGKVCAEIAESMNKWKTISFLDDSFPSARKCLDFDIIGKTCDMENYTSHDFFVAIGDNSVREKFFEELTLLKCNIVSLIHPTSYISKYCSIGNGTSIHQNVVINTDSTIGKGCIINTGTIVEHENIISDFVHLSPHVSLGGRVSVGKKTWIGIGSTVINDIKLIHNVMIGASSLVRRDILKSGIYVGNPIRRV